jgi:hypothetical protein
MLHIRIFPHSAGEFKKLDDLTTWLMTALKARGGVYYVLGDGGSRPAETSMEAGCIVLFRYNDAIVGEAVVRDCVIQSGENESGEKYQAVATFFPSSIRLFSPPIHTDNLQKLIEKSPDIGVQRTYFIIKEWSVYPQLLALVGKAGSFI